MNPDDVRQRLDQLDKTVGIPDLNATYQEIYDKNTVSGEYVKAEVRQTLQWVLVRKFRPHIQLIVDVVRFSRQRKGQTASHIDKNYILQATSNLLVVDDEEAVHFAHASVGEFLQSTETFDGVFDNLPASIAVATTCLAYIGSSYKDLPEITSWWMIGKAFLHERDDPWTSFSEYSLLNWAAHAADINAHDSFEAWVSGIRPGIFGTMTESGLRLYDNDLQLKILMSLSTPADPYLAACIWGFQDVVVAALRHRPGVIKTKCEADSELTGLCLAAENGHENIVKLILDALIPGEDFSPMLGRAHYAACTRDQGRIAELLVAKGADPDHIIEDKESLLERAVRLYYDKLTPIDLLLKVGANVRSLGKWGDALHTAAGHNTEEVAQRLLDAGADVNADGPEGSALYRACSRNQDSMIKFLVRNGADPNSAKRRGETALCLSINYGNKEAVEVLLGANANPNQYSVAQIWWDVPGGVSVMEAIDEGPPEAQG